MCLDHSQQSLTDVHEERVWGSFMPHAVLGSADCSRHQNRLQFCKTQSGRGAMFTMRLSLPCSCFALSWPCPGFALALAPILAPVLPCLGSWLALALPQPWLCFCPALPWRPTHAPDLVLPWLCSGRLPANNSRPHIFAQVV